MSDFFPAQVEQKLVEVTNRIAKTPDERARWDEARREAKRVLDVAEAHAYKNSMGTVAERNAEVTLAVQEEREAYDNAEVAFRYAESQARAMENEQSTWQTVLRSVLATYNAAGVGQR